MAKKKSSSPFAPLLVIAVLGGGIYLGRDRLSALFSKPAPVADAPEKAGAKGNVKKKRSSAGASLSGSDLATLSPGRTSYPAAKPCLDPPTGDGAPEGGDQPSMTGSRGLEADEVRAAMSGVVNYALPCFADAPTGTLTLSVTAGCDGRVSDIRISDDGGYPTDVTGCVVDILRNAAFPAHDMPDGYTFTYPVNYTAP